MSHAPAPIERALSGWSVAALVCWVVGVLLLIGGYWWCRYLDLTDAGASEFGPPGGLVFAFAFVPAFWISASAGTLFGRAGWRQTAGRRRSLAVVIFALNAVPAFLLTGVALVAIVLNAVR